MASFEDDGVPALGDEGVESEEVIGRGSKVAKAVFRWFDLGPGECDLRVEEAEEEEVEGAASEATELLPDPEQLESCL